LDINKFVPLLSVAFTFSEFIDFLASVSELLLVLFVSSLFTLSSMDARPESEVLNKLDLANTLELIL
jgi:hypothetical protein